MAMSHVIQNIQKAIIRKNVVISVVRQLFIALQNLKKNENTSWLMISRYQNCFKNIFLKLQFAFTGVSTFTPLFV